MKDSLAIDGSIKHFSTVGSLHEMATRDSLNHGRSISYGSDPSTDNVTAGFSFTMVVMASAIGKLVCDCMDHRRCCGYGFQMIKYANENKHFANLDILRR